MAIEKNLDELRVLLNDSLLSKKEALNLLARVNRNQVSYGAEILSRLQIISIEDMKTRPHRGDKKEKDRNFGQKLRIKRTGSRRG